MRRPVLTVAVALAVVVVPAAPGAGQEPTPGLSEARRRANDAAAAINRLESQLGELDEELTRLEAERAAARAELDGLRAQVAEIAVRRYTESGADTVLLPDVDLNDQARARALVRFVTGERTDTIDEYRAAERRLEQASADIEREAATQQAALADLRAQREVLEAELDRLEELEAARIEAERRAAEERARAERAAAAAAASAATTTTARTSTAGSTPATPATVGAPGTRPAPAAPPPPVSGGGGWVCPVQGARSFVDSWGAPRAGGRSHQGVDIMAPRGTPVVTPVAGTVTTKTGGIGGLTFRLSGVDGNWYYGAHLDSYSGASGFLPAGTVVGYVGDTGDAKGTSPHLHFEIHIGGYGNPVNPYPTVARYC